MTAEDLLPIINALDASEKKRLILILNKECYSKETKANKSRIAEDLVRKKLLKTIFKTPREK